MKLAPRAPAAAEATRRVGHDHFQRSLTQVSRRPIGLTRRAPLPGTMLRRHLLALWTLLVLLLLSLVRGNVFSPQDVPGPPEKVLVSSLGDAALRVQFLPPVRTKAEGNNGAPVLGYKVEVAQRINDVQTFTVEANGPVAGGSYKMTFTNGKGTDTTACVPWNATETMFETALEELLVIDSVSVTRSAYGAAKFGYVYTVVFDGKNLVSGAQPNVLVADQTGCAPTKPLNRVLTFTGSHVTAGVQGYQPEIWEIVTDDTSGQHVVGGGFDVSVGFSGDWTDSLVSATIAAGSRTAVTSASMIGKVNRGDMVKIGDEEFTVHRTAPFTDSQLPLDSYHIRGTTATAILLRDTALGDVAVTSNSATVATSSDFQPSLAVGEHVKIGQWEFLVTAITASTLTIDRIAVTGNSVWPDATTQHITAYKRKKVTIDANADAADMENALDALAGVGVVKVARVGPTWQNGYRWLVTFESLGRSSRCPESPCLRADKVTGTTTQLTDTYGAACLTCVVTASLVQDEANNAITGTDGQYMGTSVVATKEIGGIIDEVQLISTTAKADDVRGLFAVNFRNSFAQSAGATINYFDTAADVQTKLQNLPTVGRLNVTRSRNSQFGVTWSITFLSNMGDQPSFLVDTAGLSGTDVNLVVEERQKGVDTPFEAIVDGLSPSRDYYVRAFAKNINGYGSGTDVLQSMGKGALPLTSQVGSAPGASKITSTWPMSGAEIGLHFTQPDAHGSPIVKYVVEYAIDRTFGTAPIKKLYAFNPLENDIVGAFRLHYGDFLTPLLAIHTTAAELEKALRQIPRLRPVQVSRAPYVLTGTPTSRVTGFVAAKNLLSTTKLTERQVRLLGAGATINVGTDTFVVKTQPAFGSLAIEVQSGHGVADFTADRAAIKVDPLGTQMGPSGYEWTIAFVNEVDKIVHGIYPGLQIVSTLSSVEGGGPISTFGFADVQVAIPTAHFGSLEVSADPAVCDSYVVGAPSADQVLQLFAPTTVTQGGFQLQLGSETTGCITLGSRATRSNLQAALEALSFLSRTPAAGLQSRVSVQEQRHFKVPVLTGSASSKVTAYTSTALAQLTVTALTQAQVDVLLVDTVIQVSRNPNDFSRHSCEFTVATAPALGATVIPVTVVGTCADFSSEARSLKILDFHDYKIRFFGQYPTGQWPTLKMVRSAFGDGANCPAWLPAVPVYSEIHTVKYEGPCADGQRGTQTILADALNGIGGYFTLSYRGKETPAQPFQTTSASAMRDAIDSITRPGHVNVTLSRYGSYGKAWRVTFMSDDDGEDMLVVKHAFLTGQDAVISVYPTVEISSDAQRDDISGSFRLTFGGQTTEPIGHSATHAKVTQELQKLSVVDSVVALGTPGDVGVTTLTLTATATNSDAVLTNIQLNGKAVDPTLFVAVREALTIDGAPYNVKSTTPDDITLATTFAGVTGAVTIAAGVVTKQTKPLPGRVSINKLMAIVTATTNTMTFELPSDHGYVVNSEFYVKGSKFTVAAVAGAVVTTLETYMGEDITRGSPEVYIFNNRLRTTSDLSSLLTTNDAIWLRNAAGDMVHYTVASAVQSRYIPVTGMFTDSIVGATAYAASFGRKWSLVFRSYTAELETIDALPQNDWRGTAARLRALHPSPIAPLTLQVGNDAEWQTVLLGAVSPGDVGLAAKYQLTFGDETTAEIAWEATGDDVKTALEALSGIDGVSVTSMVHDNGYLHTIRFWGMYTMARLPTLSGMVTAAVNPSLCSVLVRAKSAVAHTKRDHLLLKSSEELRLRVFAVNGKGISDAPEVFSLQTATTSVVPTPPTSVVLGEYHGTTWLSIHYRPPMYTGGAAITMYRLEWDSSPNFDSGSSNYGVATIQKRFEVQQVTTSFRSNVNSGGTFTLSWGGRVSAPLPFDCSADQMTDALAVITDTTSIAINPVKVLRARASWGFTWTITFLNTPGNLALLVVDGSLLTGDFSRIAVTELVQGYSDLAVGDFTHEVQDVFTDASTALSGAFQLEFQGKVTSAISVDASALEMQDAIQALTALYSVKVTRTWRVQTLNTAIWSVTFAYLRGEEMVGAGDIFLLTVADSASLVGTAATVRVANKLVGSDPFRYTISGLRPGTRYYMHAMAYNAEGFGSATSPLSVAVTCGQPDPPKSVVASVVDGTTLAVSWTASETPDACSVDRYKVEWFRTEGIQEQQTITTSAGKGLPDVQRIVDFADSQGLGGFFKLTFGGEVTENIAWNAAPVGLDSVKARLERLSSVGTVDVSRQPSTRVVAGLMVICAGTTLTVEASSTVSLAATGLAIGDLIWILGQQRSITAVGVTLTIDTALTTSVPVPVFRTAFGFEWRVTFQAGHVGPQELLRVATSDSWAGNNPGVYVESVQRGLQPISGTFRVSFASGGLSQITQPLPHNVSAAEMTQALESLVTVGLVNVTRSPNGFGFNWIVTFVSDVKSELSLLGVDSTELHGPSVRISAVITSQGVQPGFYCETNDVPGAAAVVELPAPTRYVIGGLKTGQKYAVRVRARNSEGYGGARYISPSFQIPRSTPSAPLAVQLLVLSSRRLKVRWNAPMSDGGSPITSYKIQWDTNSDFSSVGSPTYDMAGELRVLATDFSPFFFNIALTTAGTFFARVLAVNDQGPSVPALSDPVSAVPVDRTPGQVENARATVLSSYAILVEWDHSSSQKASYGGDGGLSITQYMVEWDTSAAFDSPASFGLVDGSAQSFIVGGNDPVTGVRSNILMPNTLYSIRVTAFNAKGAGTPRPTDPPSVLAANHVPTVPRNLQLSVIPATSIKSEWQNPLYDGGLSLKSYEIQWDEQDDFASGQSSSATIPIVREIQSLTVSTVVVNEEQFVDATVEVINEVQVVRTSFTGADEVQVIQTKNDPVVDEVQTITTTATDRDEVQELRVDAADVNEIQAVRTTVAEAFEVQTIQVGVARNSEVQTIVFTLPGSTLTSIDGDLTLTFDNTVCTHCTLAVGLRRTVDVLLSLKTVSDTDGAQIVQDALNNLDNIGHLGVVVTRATSTSDGVDLVYTYTITFSGDGVTGNVPELAVERSITYGGAGNSVSGLPTAATQATPGAEVVFDPASVFEITHTCESYSDPNAITTFSAACTPPASAVLCASCVTDFDGTMFTLAVGTALMGINANDRLIAGVCVFQVDQVTATTLTIVAGDVGTLCSHFAAQTLPLYKATQPFVTVPVKTTATTISDGSVVQSQLNTIIDAVVVARTQSITSTFVGSEYTVTFRKRSGMVPVMVCDGSTIHVTSSTSVCAVSRTTKGSMLSGSFTLSLTKESDSATTATSPAIPWDASEALVKATLEGVLDGGEQVFGTVNVKRSVYSPTANKWSGGFTWQIEFTSRGWDIPKMTVTSALVNSDTTATGVSIVIEDAASPLTPFAGSRDGNQVHGTITLAYGGVTAPALAIGTDTDMTNLHTTVSDTTLQMFLTTHLGAVIPSVQVMRSAATQARGFTWTITFSDPETGGDIPMVDMPITQLTGTNVRAKMFETVKGNQLGGTFQLQFNQEKTGPILFSADKLAVQAQLNSLASIKPSSVLVDRVGPAKTGTNQVLGYTWLITFRSSQWVDPTNDHSAGITGNWKGPRAKWDEVWPETGYSKAWGRHVGPMASKGFMFTCIQDGLTTTASDNSQHCEGQVQTPGVGPIQGTFTLTMDSRASAFMSKKDIFTSQPIAHNAWATTKQSGATGTSLEEILESMPNIGDVAVSRGVVDLLTGGYTWTVTFLRDADGPCEQNEMDANGVLLCNAPGDVPAFVHDATALSGSTPAVTVCDKTAVSTCFPSVVQNGLVLRGDFTTFKVTNDPGFEQRYQVKTTCPNSVTTQCGRIDSFDVPAGSELLLTHLMAGDRFTVGTYPECVFSVVDVTATVLTVDPFNCATMLATVAGSSMGVFILLPWNAGESLVKRVLEASSDQANEKLIWAGGRKVSVQRTIHGKYGDVSWQVQFISNPMYTPPGAGNILDIATVFVPNPTAAFQISVTQTTPGSAGLSGTFLLDFASTVGPRHVAFDETEERLQRKLNEMNTIGRVIVKKLRLPSQDTGCLSAVCSGGWDDQPVDNLGTRGGYRWRVRFMKVTGEYGGLTFPSGSGNVNPLSVTLGSLLGNERSVDVVTSLPGSKPILGGFVLNTSSTATPVLPYSSSADSLKEGIESMNLFGDVDVTQNLLVGQQIPNAVATLSKDGRTATIDGVDDIRQFLAPGDAVRFGAALSSNLDGTNGDSPFTGVVATSYVRVEAMSPIVQADPLARSLLYPGMQVRIDGLQYTIQRSGAEIQTVFTAIPATSAAPTTTFYALTLRRSGSVQTSGCFRYDAPAQEVEDGLQAQLLLLDPNRLAGEIKVTRHGPVSSKSGGGVAQLGYEYSVYFLGDSIAGDVAALVVDTSACTALAGATATVAVATQGGSIPHQRLSLATDSGQVVDTVGYFQLTLGGVTTGCLPWGIPASDLEMQLEDTLLTGDVLVARRGSGNSVTEMQRIRLTSNSQVTSPATGLFQLALTVDGKTSWTSSCLAYGVSAEDMQLALNAMSNIGATSVPHVNVTRDGDGTSSWGYGYEYTVHFRGPVSGGSSVVLGNMTPLEVINVGTGPCAAVSGGEPAIMVETVRDGSDGFMYDMYFLASSSAFVPTLTINTAPCAANQWTHVGGSVRRAAVELVDAGGSAEVQTLVVKNAAAAMLASSTYKLSFGGILTNCIAFDAIASVVETQLVALNTIGASGVFVSRDVHLTAPDGFIYKVTFVGELTTGNVPMLEVVTNDAACTAPVGAPQLIVTESRAGGLAPSSFVMTALYGGERPNQQHIAYTVGQLFTVMNEQIEVQTITVTNPLNDIAVGATYTLVVLGITTTPISWDASEASLEAALTVGAVGDKDIVVTRRLDATLAPNGFVYTVYFRGSSVAGDLAEITVNSKTGFNGGDVTVATISSGVNNVPMFDSKSIPLALASDASTGAPFLASAAALSVYKVNGFLWTIKFKSTIGNVPALGSQAKSLSGKLTLFDDFLSGSASSSFVMTDLMPGIPYFVRVAASTDAGIGAFTTPASKIPSGIASPVQHVAAGYALNVREVQEVRLAAKHISEVQTISTSAATMAEVQTLRTFAAADSCFSNSCVQGAIAFRVPTIQTITVSALASITAGSFSIRFVRYTGDGAGQFTPVGAALNTAPIAWNAAADDVKTAMGALSGVAASDIIVTRDGDASAAFGYGYVFSITFVGNTVAGETSLITVNDNASGSCPSCALFVTTGNVAYSLSVAMNTGQAMGTDTAVQEVVVRADKPLFAGSYQLVFDHLGAQVPSACINFDAAARGSGDPRAMETILLQMSNIDRVYVARFVDPVRAENGFVYRVFFYGNGVAGAVTTMTAVQCVAFQTQESNALTTSGVNGQVSVSTIDAGGFDAGNTFVDAGSATAAQLESDLDRLPVFGDVIVTRSLVDLQGGFVWTVAFTDSQGNLPQFICAVDPIFAATAGTGCESTTLTDGNALSGSFVLDSSVPIPFDASAAAMKSALEAMAWVGSVQVVRAGPTAQLGYTWTVTFLDFLGDVPALSATSSLVGTASAITVTEVRKGNSIGGTFTLQYLSSTTAPIAWDAPATKTDSGGDGASMEEQLDALSVVGVLSVSRSSMDTEGGYTWLVTFLDNNLNPGDLPLLQGNASLLTGMGVVVTTREITKGSNAVGDQLWLSFDPPVTDNGSPITKYLVRWDTAASFTASPGEFAITEPEKLFQIQRVETGAASLAWSRIKPPLVDEVQTVTIASGAAMASAFTLSFRGVESAHFTVGTSTAADLLAALSGLSSVEAVTVSSATGSLVGGTEFAVKFTAKPGNLPLMTSSDPLVATVAETTAGATNYRKEVVVFNCVGNTGSVQFTHGVAVQNVAFDATLAIVTTKLHTLFAAETGSIRVLSTQAVLCAAAAPATDMTIIFDRVYGDIDLHISTAVGGPTITPNTAASIDGVFNAVEAKMSGTFQVGYMGEYTRFLNAESTATDVRYALEDLTTIETVAVDRARSFQALMGKLDVVNGQIYATCSAGEICDFKRGSHGIPGQLIRLGGRWYTVIAGTVSHDDLSSARLHLGDAHRREIGYLGATQTGVTAYEWTKGYVWAVNMLSVAQPLGYLRAKIPRLHPTDSIVKVSGSACTKCYYLPTQTTKKLVMGQEYFIDVTAFNENGKGQPLVGGPVRATPSQVPNAPSNVDLAVVSGKEIEVFFAPPALAFMNVHPNFNNDISSYLVQWDVKNDFKHGLPICASCAVALKINVLTVSQSLLGMLQVGTRFTIGSASQCVLRVAALAASRIDVDAGHGCDNFSGAVYAMQYYTFAPAVLSGLQIQGSPPFRYVIPNLVVATKYYVRVAAVNSVPVQQLALDGNPPSNRKWSFPLSATTKDMVPDAPVSVFLYPFSGSTLEVQIQPSARDGKGLGGAAITHFWVDVDTVATFDSSTKAAPVDVGVASGNIPVLYTGGPRVYYIKNLQTGIKYFVQVKAKNSIGYSRATLAPNPLAPTRHPDGPVNVKVSTVTTAPTPIDAATVTWQPPIGNGGLPVTSYRVEWWGAVARPEIQVIEIKWTTAPTTARFNLAFGGGATGDMPVDVQPENVRSALMNIIVGGAQVVQHVEVSRATVNLVQGFQWRVTFLGALNTGDQPLIQFAFANLVDGTDVTGRVFEAQAGVAVPQLSFPGRREVQVLMTSHAMLAVGGYFRLSYKGSAWSNYLSASIAADDLRLALEALPTVGKVTVNLQGPSQNGLIWTISFESAVGNLPPLVVDGAKLTPAGAFVGVKDGDNAVGTLGKLCVPGDDGCAGSWGSFLTGIAALPNPGETAVDYNYYETIDATALTYKIIGLEPGKTYYVAVTAKNALGLGERVKSAPTAIVPPVQVPGAPTQVSVGVNPGVATQLTATWAAPASDGGSAVRMYRVEYDPSPLFRNRGVEDFWCPTAPTSAVWLVQTSRVGGTGDPIGSGFFNVVLTRQNQVLKTEPIPFNAVAMASSEAGNTAPSNSLVFCTACADCTDTCASSATFPFQRRELSGSLESKLEYLTTVNSVQVVRSASAAGDGGFAWTITFNDVGDDFVLAPDATNALTCATNACSGATYQVTTTKLKSGVSNPVCTGTKVIPRTGALNKGQLYYARVFAFNKIGFSLPALAPSPQKPMVVPGPPTGVTLQVLSVSDLKVLFSPPDDNGGDTVVEYVVEWSTDNVFTTVQSGSVVLLAGGAPYYRVISNLVKGTFYFVRVKARNAQGFGQYQISSPTSLNPYTTPSAPTKVTMGVTALTMLTVQWNVPDDNGGDAITGYVVQWDISSGFDSLSADATKAKITDVTQRSYTITLLSPGTVYYVRVFAVNSGGPGTAQTATPTSLVPVNTRPGKPHSLQAAPTANNGELQVTWQMPRIPAHGIPCSGTQLVPLACPIYASLDVVFGGSSLESYLVQWADNADFTGSDFMSVTTTQALIQHLDSGKLYFVRVLTVNSEGLKSDFCTRANANLYLCPDNLVLLDGSIVTGAFVSATPK